MPAASGGLDRYLTSGSLERLPKSPEVSGSGVEQLPPLGERQAVDVADPEDSGAVVFMMFSLFVCLWLIPIF